MNKRLSYIDNVAGIMILWMILGHCSLFSGFCVPGYSILGFYMPWFFYKSGMFFQTRNQPEPLSPLVLSVICFALAFSLYYFGWYNYSWWFGN